MLSGLSPGSARCCCTYASMRMTSASWATWLRARSPWPAVAMTARVSSSVAAASDSAAAAGMAASR
jgi:hypothetical protein